MDVSLGERLQLLRQRRGLTQQKLADEAGVSKMTIIRIEKGKSTNMQLQTLRSIAKAPGVGLDELLAASEQEKRPRRRAAKTAPKAG
jgi:transcriptional regulator with XRE-family HTH domain